MGLDMYLSAKRYLRNKEEDISKQVGEIIGVEGDIEKRFQGSSLVVKEITLDAMYWRKANAIHGWFVENCQNGDDDCKEYEVEREQLVELRKLCQDILDNPNNDNGDLDPTEGFFFGSTEKDEWYYEDLKNTVEGLDRVLALPDQYSFHYRASW